MEVTMVIALLPVLVTVIGLVVYVLASNPKAAELGRIAFAVGLLITVYVMAGSVLKV